MKRFLYAVAVAVCLLVATACSPSKWTTINNNDKAHMEQVMSERFPELYERYNKGEIEVHKIKYRTQEDGTIKWTMYYRELSNDDDDELLEWMLIFAPVLMD